jgi:hypothetical protein
MKRLIALSLIAVSGCHADWRRQAVEQAEATVRQQVKNPALHFSRVRFTGDRHSGQTCGYFEIPTADGGQTATRFIVFIDGGGGQNPFIDDPSAPFPSNKEDFGLNWRTQCLDLGYAG